MDSGLMIWDVSLISCILWSIGTNLTSQEECIFLTHEKKDIDPIDELVLYMCLAVVILIVIKIGSFEMFITSFLLQAQLMYFMQQ